MINKLKAKLEEINARLEELEDEIEELETKRDVIVELLEEIEQE